MNDYGTFYHSTARRQYAIKIWLREFFATWKQPHALAALLDELPRGARVLDVGSGQGSLPEKLAQYRPDLEIVAFDLAPAGQGRGYAWVAGDACRLPFQDGRFQLVLCRHVIEHIPEAMRMVHELERVLAVDGRLYLDCPDVRSAMSWSPLNFWEDPTHLRPYTPAGLQRVFELGGMTALKTGRVRDWRLVLFGVFYLPVAVVARDRFFRRHWLANLFGIFIYGVAAKRRVPLKAAEAVPDAGRGSRPRRGPRRATRA
ncbi:MAG TPA: methyltransferase domain-containing protein [Gammaproteobacteria bacterium]|jgi:SAM-dependent methyltransferase|nr:methyltransferase domain-containing protein [Gammaproteobacteria bacterium]